MTDTLSGNNVIMTSAVHPRSTADLPELSEVIRTLRERLADGHAGDPGVEIEDALQRWPCDPDLHLIRLHWLENAGHGEALCVQLKRSREQFPNCPHIALAAFRGAVGDGDVRMAADLLCDVIWPSRPTAETRERCLDALLGCPAAYEDAEAALLRLLEVEADCAAILIRLAALYLRHGRFGSALEQLERAEASAPLPREASSLRIEALLNASEWDDAFGRSLEHALRAVPDARQVYGLKFDFHERRGEGEAARACLALARRRFPDEPWFALRAFRLCISEKDQGGAAVLFDQEIWRSSLPESARRGALGALVREWKDSATLQAFLTGLLQETPDDRFILVKLASAATRRRRHFDAVQYLEKAERHGPLPAEAESMRINMLVLGGDAEGSLALAKRQMAAHPDRKDLVRRANIVASIGGNQDDITQTMWQALTQWPTDASILQRYNRAVIPAAEDQRLFEHIASVDGVGSTDGRWRYQFALACLRRNETPRACTVLRELIGDGQVGFEAQRLLGVLETLPVGDWDVRARFSNDATTDVRVIKASSAAATVVVMAGLHGGLGNIPPSHLDVLLQQHPVNVVYLRDNRWSAFTRGVPGLGPDEASSVAALAALCADLGPMPVVTFGGSLGGWSAMRYGALMGAQVAVSLAGPTRLAVQDDQSARFAQHYLARILPEPVRDLLDLLRRTPDLHVIHAYGAHNAKDCANAARLSQIDNVTLLPVEDCGDHFVAAHLVASGNFHPLIEQAIATARAAASA